MMHIRHLKAVCATIAIVASGMFVFAQDDLDALLKDLESDTKAEAKTEVKAEVEVKDEGEGEEAKAEAEAEVKAEEAKAQEAEVKVEGEGEEVAAAEEKAEEKVEAAAEEKVEEAEVKAEGAEVAKVKGEEKVADDEAELLANIQATEMVRRKAFDAQARREIAEARASMEAKEYDDAADHYIAAGKLLNDSNTSKKLRKECETGAAQALYRAALEEDNIGRRDRAIKKMEKALALRHPKARAQLKLWNAEKSVKVETTDLSDFEHRKNDEEYKKLRKKDNKLLQRSRQLMAIGDLDAAQEQCEMVLVKEPYNQQAIRLKKEIEKKRHTILKQERVAARDGMIADVDEAWRPVYAPNARQIDEVAASTVKSSLGEDPERALEQTIVKRMKEMRLPAISFKPPATIIDAIDFFRGASKDFDRPEIPVEKRGFNFVLKTKEALKATKQQSEDEDTGFAADDGTDDQQAQQGVPVIPMITASDITLYEAMKLVCDSVDFKFKVQGPIVMVMPKDMSTDEMVFRSYPVMGAFLEKMDSASSDMKEMKSQGFGSTSSSKRRDEDQENKELDWKDVFSSLGVEWPEGSSIYYMKSIGKLRVKNTYENLAELEKALIELNAEQKLIEIEARFVEVCQEDLNSLGFEWILNSDYTLNANNWLGRTLGLKEGAFVDTTQTEAHYARNSDGTWGWKEASNLVDSRQSTSGATWSKANNYLDSTQPTYDANGSLTGYKSLASGNRDIGISSFGGTDSSYGNGNRYLSQTGNHVSGEGVSVNDQFMRVNAFLGSADLSMILHMLSQRSDTDLLSAPKVLTKPGEEAVIKVVTEYIYPTDYDVQLQSSSSSSGSSSSSSQSAILAVVEPQSFETREVGVILETTPTLTDDGNLIDLKIKAQVVDEPTWKNYGMKIPFTGNSSLQSFEGIGGIFEGLADIFTAIGANLSSMMKETFAEAAMSSAVSSLNNLTDSSSGNITYYDAPMEQPFFHVRSVDSSISIYPGATIVMGGLITEERKAMDDKVPFLGDIPFIGRLFRSHAEMTNKRNLLIFVTTRLVDVRGREVTVGQNDVKEAPEVKEAPDAKEASAAE